LLALLIYRSKIFLTSEFTYTHLSPLFQQQLSQLLPLYLNQQKEEQKNMLALLFEEKFRQMIEKNAHNNQSLLEKFGHLQQNVGQELFNMSEKINLNVDQKLLLINNKVQESLNTGFKNNNETFQGLIARLAKIDEAQKKIEMLSTNVVSLQDVLTDKKSRGIFGEVQLHQILSKVFGEKNDAVYKLQFTLSNHLTVDSMLFLPKPTGNLAVDSKFPLENYRRMYDSMLSDEERKLATKEFKGNVKKHIDDISRKYIIAGETSEQAIMFLPAEAIFAEIHAYHPDIIEYAQEKKVWPASPTTFMAMLTTIQVVLNNIERSKYTHVIHQELNKLSDEFGRYKKRWDSLASHIETVSKDVSEIRTTTDKITNRFHKISNVKFDDYITQDKLDMINDE